MSTVIADKHVGPTAFGLMGELMNSGPGAVAREFESDENNVLQA